MSTFRICCKDSDSLSTVAIFTDRAESRGSPVAPEMVRLPPPPLEEIEQYAHRLSELKNGGAEIALVQIYSATRPTANSDCGHLPLKVLSRIAANVRQATGLKAEVF